MSEHDEDAVVVRLRDAIRKRLYDDNLDSPDNVDVSYAQIAETALAALKPGDRLPGGLRVVPAEPTWEMLEEGTGEQLIADDSEARDVYVAMLAASAGQ